MAVVRQELPGYFQDKISSKRLFRRTRVAKQADPLLTQRAEEKVILETSPVKEALRSLAPSLRGAKMSISEANADPDNPMNLIVSFDRKLSIRRLEISWRSVVVSAVRDKNGRLTDDLNINSKIVPKDTDGDQLMAILRRAADISFPPVWTMPDKPGPYLRERWRIGRERIPKAKAKRMMDQ